MKLESAYFDKIRMRTTEAAEPKAHAHSCDAPGCAQGGEFRAPKGRNSEGEYYWFCLDHVRAYNKSYNFFSGMKDEAIEAYQKDATFGHRPTWKMGVNAKAADQPPPTGRTKTQWPGRKNPFHTFSAEQGPRRAAPEPRRRAHNMERKSLAVLGLGDRATAQEVKTRYKLLVKQNHPDANGGDRSYEDRFREIIQAYNYLKSVGYV
ncbi:DnaJ domain-containing protein [Faunimonas pinastri]|uniref:DnaJ domain-containing protein n=1 Tax=Faunimonas pinastri TaxID=1855383 RepID=A0A1H9C941_9HYPH|nr:DnaJ domain-containing protein [Faunimonas pinastri]SEP97198.1 DnaJ domain-containing protein [Faunimonas pinastri]